VSKSRDRVNTNFPSFAVFGAIIGRMLTSALLRLRLLFVLQEDYRFVLQEDYRCSKLAMTIPVAL